VDEVILLAGRDFLPGRTVLQAHELSIRLPAWLDVATGQLVRAIIAEVSAQHQDLRAAILFGSMARHEERPLSDHLPSDVDLLLLFDLEPHLTDLPYERLLAVYESVGTARGRSGHTPREVQVTVAVRDLADWDPVFVQNLTHDGILLWARGTLPAVLAAIETREA
jgi:predicted nucleotidyltransferase